MSDISDLMRRAATPASQPASAAAPRPKKAPGDMHPAHLENAIRKAQREGDTARLAELQAAQPKE